MKKQMAVGLAVSGDRLQISCCSGSGEPVSPEGEKDNEAGTPLPDALKDAFAGGDLPEGTEEILETFLSEQLQKAAPKGDFSLLRVMVSMQVLDRKWWEIIPEVLKKLGIERRNIFLQDYQSSFFYYAVSQKKELWNGDVALLTYENEDMVGYLLTIDRSKSPALARVQEAARQSTSDAVRDGRNDQDWDRERDRLLFELLKKVFERRNVVTVYVVSPYYDRSWAERSFQYMLQHRHAFQGENLYTRGACYGAMERAGMLRIPELLFVGADVVQDNLGMYLRVKGKRIYYPLVTAGVSWYEAYHECEIIPDGEDEIEIVSRPMEGGEEVTRILRLKDFPQRPRRATRLRLTLYFTSPSCAVIEVEDLGFGGLFRPSGRRWTRKIIL